MRTARELGRLRGKRATLCLLCLTLIAVTAGVFAGRGYLLDSWWIWRLKSADRATRNLTAEKLAERKCLRAVPEIMSLIVEDHTESIHVATFLDFTTWDYSVSRYATPLILAIWKMGKEALPAIDNSACTIDSDVRIQRILQALRDRTIPMGSADESARPLAYHELR
jgi:hypothetical protein